MAQAMAVELCQSALRPAPPDRSACSGSRSSGAGDLLADLDRFGANGTGEQPRGSAAAAAVDDQAEEVSGYVAPPYTEPPVRKVALGALLAAAGYGKEAAAQLDEAAAAEMVTGIFKDSRKVRGPKPGRNAYVLPTQEHGSTSLVILLLSLIMLCRKEAYDHNRQHSYKSCSDGVSSLMLVVPCARVGL